MNWDYWLGRKYDLLGQNAQAGLISANANANLDNVRAGLLPNESAANVAEQQARTAGTLETNKTIAPLAASTIGLQRRQGQYYGANAGFVGSQANQLDILNRQSPFELYLQQLKAGSGLTTGGL
jgi:hypothetical protein